MRELFSLFDGLFSFFAFNLKDQAGNDAEGDVQFNARENGKRKKKPAKIALGMKGLIFF